MRHFNPRHPSQPTLHHSHGLWSLWDMLELKAGAFLNAATSLAGTASFISGTNATPSKHKTFQKDTRLDDPDRGFLRSRFTGLPDYLRDLGADVTALCLADAESKISQSWATWDTAKTCFEEITNTLHRELSLKTVLALQPAEAA